MEAENKANAVIEYVAVTKEVEDEAGASTAQHTHHQFGTLREK